MAGEDKKSQPGISGDLHYWNLGEGFVADAPDAHRIINLKRAQNTGHCLCRGFFLLFQALFPIRAVFLSQYRPAAQNFCKSCKSLVVKKSWDRPPADRKKNGVQEGDQYDPP